jgi:hypothetical protein
LGACLLRVKVTGPAKGSTFSRATIWRTCSEPFNGGTVRDGPIAPSCGLVCAFAAAKASGAVAAVMAKCLRSSSMARASPVSFIRAILGAISG